LPGKATANFGFIASRVDDRTLGVFSDDLPDDRARSLGGDADQIGRHDLRVLPYGVRMSAIPECSSGAIGIRPLSLRHNTCRN
jgi:hypothetical protein